MIQILYVIFFHCITPSNTHRDGSLVGMHARARRVDRALELKKEMDEKKFPLTAHGYGQLIHACSIQNKKEMLQTAMSLCEEMGQKGLRTRERFLRELRVRCQRLHDEGEDGFEDLTVIPPHPKALMKTPYVKSSMRKRAKKSRRRLQEMASGVGYLTRTTVR